MLLLNTSREMYSDLIPDSESGSSQLKIRIPDIGIATSQLE